MKSRLFLILFTILLPQVASAFKVDGVCYWIYQNVAHATCENDPMIEYAWEPYFEPAYYPSSLSGDVVIQDFVDYEGSTYPVRYIDFVAFKNSLGIESVTIGNMVTNIEQWAFQSCSNLEWVKFGKSVKYVDQWAFSGCYKMQKVFLNDSLQTIAHGAFGGCRSLTDLNLNEGLEKVGSLSFTGCVNLKVLTIPNSVKYIYEQAFNGCSSLASIYSKIQDLQNVNVAYDIFNGVDKNTCKLYIPKGTMSMYKSKLPWNEFTNIIEVDYNEHPGDVNGDGTVSSVDVTALYNYLLNGDSDNIVNGDLDSDGKITAVDITILYNILLGNE